ncbi:MAG: IS701 family transposase [Deltaproteobacteria bacterium]|nr:IS701 family transposase [Deltaproteobacteria bacterium]
MLPVLRNDGDVYSIPKFELDKTDVKGFTEELRGYHEQFRDCFSRSEPRENFFLYMVGQYSQLERKSIEPIALQVEDGNVRAMQRFISDVVLDEPALLKKYHALVAEDMAEPDAVLIFDESGFPKKGYESAGVARQYCGSIGKVDNCQMGVFAAYASRHGYALVDKRLYAPEKWFGEDFRVRREKCKFPSEQEFKTKPQLAAEMFQGLRTEGILPFKYVAADSIYGANPDFISAIEENIGIIYFVSVPSTTQCWLQGPVTEKQVITRKGNSKVKRVVAETEKSPAEVATLAKGINKYFWYRRTVSEGTKGPITYEFTKRRITLSRDGLPCKTVWLIIRRTLGGKPEYSFYISNAPVSTRLAVFVWLSGIRWAIEQCFEECKTELGMDHYEVRKFPGWHHHILTCMLAHFFLWHIRIRLGKKNAISYAVAA